MEFNDLNWPAAPGWALFVGSLGKGLVTFGLAAFLLTAVLWLLEPKSKLASRLGAITFSLAALAVVGSMVCLGALFVAEQFEYEYVQRSIQTGLELKYRIAAIWAHQEGSFLLWAVASAIFGLLAVRQTGVYRRWFTVVYSFFLASLCGILTFESPFALGQLVHGKVLVPPTGAGLTPSLQNYWVVIHPPTIFLGFGSLAVPFCWALAALLTNDRDRWVAAVRPWALASLAILGLGLCMGGFWAYETLGWGGFWAWDPVENVSFVPWILMATFIHGLIVQASGKGWYRANIIFACLPFLAFVYGTYLTRSGIYADVSVHSFAQMDRTALKILLGLLGVGLLAFLAPLVFRWFAWEPTNVKPEVGVTRQAGYAAGNLILTGIGLTTAFGMSVPLIQFLGGKKPSIVEEPMYHQVLGWFFPIMLVLMAAVPFLSWKGAGPAPEGETETTMQQTKRVFAHLSPVLNRLLVSASLSFMFTGFAVLILKLPNFGVGLTGDETVAFAFGKKIPALPWLAFLLFLCIFVGVTNLGRMIDLRKSMKLSFGGFVAHIGVAILMTGMILSRGFERKEQLVLQQGETGRALGYAIEYKGFTSKDITSRDNKAEFFVQGANGSFVARPGLYTFESEGEQKWMTWPHIERTLTHDIYFSLHEPQLDVWPQPMSIKPGETLSQDRIKVTYEKLIMHGQPGKPGTQFGAQLKVETPDGIAHVEPSVEIGTDGLRPHLARINQDLMISMQGINAADKSAVLQVHFAKPLWPIELFYKPMTSLVWLGAGILTLGGAMAALYRRKALAPNSQRQTSPSQAPRVDDAIVPAPQM